MLEEFPDNGKSHSPNLKKNNWRWPTNREVAVPFALTSNPGGQKIPHD